MCQNEIGEGDVYQIGEGDHNLLLTMAWWGDM